MKKRKEKVIQLKTDLSFDELLKACATTPLPKKKRKAVPLKKAKK